VKRDDEVTEGQVLADLEIAALERSLEQAELELARARSRQETAERNLAYDQEEAAANLEISQLQLSSLRSSPRPENAAISIQEERVHLAELAVERLSHGIDSLIINDVDSAALQVSKLKAEIEEAQIIAPFDGRVMSISLTPGQAVEGYRPVVVVADVSALEVSSDLLSNQMSDIQENMDATVSLLNSPGVEIDGFIRQMPYPYGSGGSAGDKVEDRDKSTRIRLEVSPDEAGYELGDLVRVVVIRERKDDVFWLPPQAIRNFDGRRFVVLVEDDAQRRVDVLVGIETQTRVELEEGVEAGQVVIGP
jgi:multidrug efflux pump subunit AcrA (membrane-fusion protein)